jgi:predicted extracellular nuclease
VAVQIIQTPIIKEQMKYLQKIISIALGVLSLSAFVQANAQVLITEVDASGSSTTTYAADWFELTNYGSTAVDITGWKMDDNSDSFSLAVPLNLAGNSIAAGQSVVFIESTGSTPAATIEANFKSAWFGSNVPTGFTMGDYSGSGVGLSTTSDAVNIFNASGTQVTGVDFNASTNHVTFDNSVAKVTNDGVISTLSVAGVNGAFLSPTGEVGSPGAVPEPSAYALMLGGLALMLVVQRLRRRNTIDGQI